LILAANRDEFYARPTSYAHWWENEEFLAGKDLKGGGTWLGVSKSGNVAAVTNYRDPANIRPDAKTRGNLVTDYLNGFDGKGKDYLQLVSSQAGDYNGFNLLIMENEKALHFSNYENKVSEVTSGTHLLTNALLDTSWPKAEKLESSFSSVIQTEFTHQDVLSILEDDATAEDHELPETGLPYDLEKAVSAVCIKTENYGTCCSTVITIDHENKLTFTERSFLVGDRTNNLVVESFDIQ